jgi:hypothetical protein
LSSPSSRWQNSNHFAIQQACCPASSSSLAAYMWTQFKFRTFVGYYISSGCWRQSHPSSSV